MNIKKMAVLFLINLNLFQLPLQCRGTGILAFEREVADSLSANLEVPHEILEKQILRHIQQQNIVYLQDLRTVLEVAKEDLFLQISQPPCYSKIHKYSVDSFKVLPFMGLLASAGVSFLTIIPTLDCSRPFSHYGKAGLAGIGICTATLVGLELFQDALINTQKNLEIMKSNYKSLNNLISLITEFLETQR